MKKVSAICWIRYLPSNPGLPPITQTVHLLIMCPMPGYILNNLFGLTAVVSTHTKECNFKTLFEVHSNGRVVDAAPCTLVGGEVPPTLALLWPLKCKKSNLKSLQNDHNYNWRTSTCLREWNYKCSLILHQAH